MEDLELQNPNATPQKPETGNQVLETVGHWLREVLETIIPAVLIALVINLFLAQATQVYGQSMEPNLHHSQRLVVEKISYHFHGPRRGDVVVLRSPQHNSELLIKRVIGLPGEKVEIHDGLVYIDGVPLAEPYLTQGTAGYQGPIVVPPLHVYVLGDNRNFSNDSRSFGPVPLENIVGRAWLSYWPLTQAGLVH
ncbi:MAG: signal peptidase I [Anaerolineae bacterium]|jgi:signal peptidase I|nr:signal peptidase I [Anaerolineae bacterium]MDH7472427.1 signal peptidase I [Anaerolineae bacterium]